MTDYYFGPWIEHDGNGIPVSDDTLVCVKFVAGYYDWEDRPLYASVWDCKEIPEHSNWVIDREEESDDAAIIAYRIATPIT